MEKIVGMFGFVGMSISIIMTLFSSSPLWNIGSFISLAIMTFGMVYMDE